MDIYKFLTQLGIDYQKINHQSVSTVEEAMFINEQIDGVACKNLFLKSSDKQFFIYMMTVERRADLKYIAKQIGSKRLSFASDEELVELLKLIPGSVTPLGIINDNKRVKILIDRELRAQRLLIHPNINTATISITYDDLLLFINACGNEYLFISINFLLLP